MIDHRCPTFSWGGTKGATAYELVVFRLPEDSEASLNGPEPLFRERLAGGALSWTPSMEQCLSRGRQYAWLVRAHAEGGASDWSKPRLFEVLAGLSTTEVEEALTVLQTHLASAWIGEGTPSGEISLATALGTAEKPRVRSTRSETTTENGLAPATTAIRGVASELTGASFGLHGISLSTEDDSAGVVGESTATSGATFGVLGEVQSAAGVAGAFNNTDGGKILSGLDNGVEVFSVDGAGEVTASSFVGDGSGLTNLSGTVPTGAVMFFNLSSCPSGWTALAAAQGRYLVGLSSGGALGGAVGTALTNSENRPTGEHVHPIYIYGSGGDTARRIIKGISYNASVELLQPSDVLPPAGSLAGTNAPYLQLLVCQKD